MELTYNTIKKYCMVGLFWLEEDAKSYPFEHDHVFKSEHIGEPIIGFTDDIGQFEYEDRDHLSIDFASIDNLSQLLDFVSQYGSLYGESAKYVRVNDLIHLINSPSELDDFWGRSTGQSVSAKAKKSVFNSGWIIDCKNEVVRYEPIEAWTTSIHLMRAAYLMNELTSRDFKIKEEPRLTEGRELTIMRNSRKNILKIYSDCKHQVTRLVLCGIKATNGLLRNEWRAHNRPSKEIDCDENGSHVSFISTNRGDIGFVVEGIAIESTTPSGQRKEIRNLFTRIIQWLVVYNNPSALFRLIDGGVTYEFGSLNSFLWFDFMRATVDTRGLSLCDRCGKPFLKGNRGLAKRFCSANCRKMYSKEKLRAESNE